MRVAIALMAIMVFTVGCSTKTTIIKTSPIDEAPESFKQSQTIASDNHLDEAKKLYFAGKYEQAIKHLVRSIASNSENWETYYYLGLVQQKKERFDQAIGSFNNSLKYAPADNRTKAKITFSLAFSWEQEGYLDKAREKYLQAMNLDPDLQSAQAAIDRVKAKTEKTDKKKKQGEKAF